ncbi:MAG: hypothetical protein JKY49_14510 [Cohaesibacteraceae bacterium]|nr:hypothetical protein [Cohaesibacteraceae bacterium]MBL4875541.1 hypothetical protein [Cohaesibacteraceae bacterium]
MTHKHIPVPVGGHVQLRHCAKCNCNEMKPVSAFSEEGLGGLTEHGMDFRCPQCNFEVEIPQTSSLFVGALIAVFWVAVGVWQFVEGPLWYATTYEFILQSSWDLLIMDALYLLFTLAVIGLSGWTCWHFLLQPLNLLRLHPVTGENRPWSHDEQFANSKRRRRRLLEFLFWPALFFGALLGVYWALDFTGFDIRDNDLVKYGAAAVVFTGAAITVRSLKLNAAMIFLGVVFWFAVVIGMVFYLG